MQQGKVLVLHGPNLNLLGSVSQRFMAMTHWTM